MRPYYEEDDSRVVGDPNGSNPSWLVVWIMILFAVVGYFLFYDNSTL